AELLDKEVTLLSNNQSYQVTIVGVANDSKIGEMIYLSTDIINGIAEQALTSYSRTMFSLAPLEQMMFIPAEAEAAELNDSQVQLNNAAFQQYCAVAGLELEQCKDQVIGQ